MKKSMLLCGLLVAVSQCVAFQTRHYMVSRDDAYYKKESQAIAQLNTLFAAGQYDSAIQYCSRARKENFIDYSKLELALATAYWYKNDRSTAYLYVQNNADYGLKLTGGGGNPFDMLNDYTFGPALATDTFLQRLIVTRVSDYYRTLDYYPDRNTGLKLLLLNAQWQRLKEKHNYDQKQELSKARRLQIEQRYKEDVADWSQQLVSLLQDNGNLFTRTAVGPAAEEQISMIVNLDQLENLKACLPLVQRALQTGDIAADDYVAVLVAEQRLLASNTLNEARVRDSLCRVYRCKTVTFDSTGRGYSYAEGKYINMKSDTLYYKSGDSTKMIISAPQPYR
ncbi:hypothetical protein [Taibaiella koreensis]|uniref:hypothetical protein n=1 Tax=Taibaiella koreensis TaxID=1268548 RepID=UPI000E59F10D|nr:hypothetical protein [Taibaiella koreensis]